MMMERGPRYRDFQSGPKGIKLGYYLHNLANENRDLFVQVDSRSIVPLKPEARQPCQQNGLIDVSSLKRLFDTNWP